MLLEFVQLNTTYISNNILHIYIRSRAHFHYLSCRHTCTISFRLEDVNEKSSHIRFDTNAIIIRQNGKVQKQKPKMQRKNKTISANQQQKNEVTNNYMHI